MLQLGVSARWGISFLGIVKVRTFSFCCLYAFVMKYNYLEKRNYYKSAYIMFESLYFFFAAG